LNFFFIYNPSALRYWSRLSL